MNEFTDKYAKLIFADPALGLRPPYDLAALRDSLTPDQRPVTRTYTLRGADAQRQQLAIDFVVHGDKGIAAPWAAQAEPGDTLTLSGAGRAYRPVPGSDWHLFAGDAWALPAICSALEALPAMPAASPTSRRATPASTWTRPRPVALTSSGCTGRSRGASPACWPTPCWPAVAPRPGRRVRARGARVDEGGPRGPQGPARRRRPLSLSGYWASGRTEDVFQSEKRQPVGQI